jgi:hypothetical protein
MENLDDQTRKLLQDDQAYNNGPEAIRQLADSIWSDITKKLDADPDLNIGDTALTPGDPALTPGDPALASGTPGIPARRRSPRTPWLIAASVTGLMLLAGALFWPATRPRHSPQPQTGPAVANLLVRQDLDRVNQTDRSQTVYLADGSKVVLQPGSGIRHAAFLRKDKREVYLEGNAYFEVAKDARRPFYVYSGDVVVRVLGTSFKVATDKENGDITVLVTTGKVAVTKKTAPLPEPLILTTNQIAFYKGHSRDLVQLPAGKKDLAPEAPPAPAISFDFEETPVTEIFQTLENAYGIPFHYDRATFSHCVLTTSLTDESLEEKIKIICEGIGATYELKEDGIFLEGKGCK